MLGHALDPAFEQAEKQTAVRMDWNSLRLGRGFDSGLSVKMQVLSVLCASVLQLSTPSEEAILRIISLFRITPTTF